MIKDNEPVSMAESLEYVKEDKENDEDIARFIKKFVNLKPKEAKEFKRKIQELDLMKVKQNHIAKIVDLMPENEEDLNKIFIDVSLDEDESKKILEIVKEFK